MIYPIISLKDEKIGFGAPQIKHNKDVAIREFLYQVKNSPFGKDLTLYQLGNFNEETGTIEAYERPEIIERGENVYGKNEI